MQRDRYGKISMIISLISLIIGLWCLYKTNENTRYLEQLKQNHGVTAYSAPPVKMKHLQWRLEQSVIRLERI
jgi:hypothetical protein